jgi:hypothetical protein
MPRFALIAILLAGCAAHRQYFQPTERQHGETVHGYPEALYTLVGPHGQFGEGKVWSNGAYHSARGESVVHVGIEIHNTSGEPIELRAADVELESVATLLGTVAHVPPGQAKDRVFAPGSIGETGFEFTLPDEVAPGEVTGFLLRWRVRNADQSYGQRTPFGLLYRRRAYPPAYGYGYPYWGCDPFDPFCQYPYGTYYGPGFAGSYYYPAYPTVVPVPPPYPGVIIHPRR